MASPARLQRSQHLSWFAHMGAVYLFHDLYGYLMEMSPDIAELIEAFEGGADTAEVLERFKSRFDGQDPAQFVDVLSGHAVVIEPDEVEVDGIWPFVPIKGKWNIWQRRDDRLHIYTAWGDRPITEVMLDPDETQMWDAFDGEKRLNELRGRFDMDKLGQLVRRLTHSNVQALKLSMMPWSTYAKRPGLAPAYLASTMPYAPWRPGEPVPAAQELTDYYRSGVADADAQFDHEETTLSHLFRVKHPALRERTYGEALIDQLIARDLVPTGAIRVLEIGAGLGYVARDAIARLRAAGRNVEYTIAEVSPPLEAAQRARLGEATAGAPPVTWKTGDVLALELPDAAFDLVLCNEMVGDLPATQLSRRDVGLDIDGGGEVDAHKLETRSPDAAAAQIRLDDAPEPFYLQHGAIALVAKLARWLAPGGTAVVTEFGDTNKYPTLSTHLDHPELSTHFGHLLQVAKHVGLTAAIEFVIDLVDMERDQQGLVTSRSQFRALRALCRDSGVDLHKIGYTPALLDHAVAGKLDLAGVGDLRFDKLEDRLMGLVPHEFRALVATKRT